MGTLARQDFTHGHKRPKKQLGNNMQAEPSPSTRQKPQQSRAVTTSWNISKPYLWVSNRHYTDMTAL